MAPDKISREISSTEKLLQIIRSEPPEPLPASDAPQPVAPSIGRKSARRSPAFPFTGKTKIAVQMGQGELRLIKVRRRSGKRYELLDTRSLPVPENRRTGSELVELLKSSLDDFTDPGKQTELWTLVQDSMAEIRQIRIPKVGKKQLINEIHRAIKEQVQPDEQATVIDYIVLGEATEQGVAKLAVMVLLVPRRDLDDIQALFAAAGYRVTGISLGPFAVENLLRCGWIQSETAGVANLYIGQRHSRIDVFSKGRLQLSRTIRTGIDSMVGSLQDQLRERRAGSIFGRQNGDPGDDVTRCSPKNGMDAEQARQMVGRLVFPEAEFEAGSGAISLSRDQVFAGIRPAVDRLIRQVERTLQYSTGTLGNEPAGTLYLSGPLGSSRLFSEYFEQQLGFASHPLDPLAVSKNEPGSALERAERVQMATAAGLALSDNRRTANLLSTHKDREKLARVNHFHQMILMTFLLAIAACIFGYQWQLQAQAEKRNRLSRVEEKLNAYQPRIDQTMIRQLAAEFEGKHLRAEQDIRSLMPLALIREVTAITPDKIRLLRLDAHFDTGDPDAAEPGTSSLVLEGLVLGDRKALESRLAGYLLALNGSFLLDGPTVTEHSFETYEDLGETLHFTAELKILHGIDGS